MVKLRVPIAALILTGLVACSGGHAGHATQKVSGPRRAPTTTSTTSPYDRYNPTHDPTKCVRINPDGTVSYTIVTPTPSYDPTKMDQRIYGKCG